MDQDIRSSIYTPTPQSKLQIRLAFFCLVMLGTLPLVIFRLLNRAPIAETLIVFVLVVTGFAGLLGLQLWLTEIFQRKRAIKNLKVLRNIVDNPEHKPIRVLVLRPGFQIKIGRLINGQKRRIAIAANGKKFVTFFESPTDQEFTADLYQFKSQGLLPFPINAVVPIEKT